jgi:hypothetical protein
MTDDLKGRIVLLDAEAMIGQGFCNEALELLKTVDKYYTSRAVEKETTVEGAEIKTKRLPDEEIFKRFNDYVNYKTLIGTAYAKKGLISSRLAGPGIQ